MLIADAGLSLLNRCLLFYYRISGVFSERQHRLFQSENMLEPSIYSRIFVFEPDS